MSQVKRKRRRRQPDLLADRTGIHTIRSGLHQQAKNSETGFVAKSSKAFGGI